MELPVIHVRWSSVIPCEGADASPIPSRGGVYELICSDSGGTERSYVGASDDLRRAFVSHCAGTEGGLELRRSFMKQENFFRYWVCEGRTRRHEVVAALGDLHYYEHGAEPIEDAGLVRLQETE